MAVDPTFLQQITEAASLIPDGAWGFMAGAAVTIVTTVIGNRHARKLQTKQLDHEKEEAQIERFVDMRKLVYVEAADELVKANLFMGSLTTADLTTLNVGEKIGGFLSSMIKLQIVGTTDTAKAANGLASSYGEAVQKLVTATVPLRMIADDLKSWDAQYEQNLAEVQRLSVAMKQFSESGSNDIPRFETLSKTAAWHQNELAMIESERRKPLRAKHLATLNKIVLDLPPIITKLMKEHGELLVHIRKELGVGGSADEFAKMLDDQAARMTASLQNSVAEINAQAQQ